MLRRLRQQPADAGAALIEFGLVLPVLCGIVLGLITAGIAFFARLQVSTAAEEGARALYVGNSRATAESAVRNALDAEAVVDIDVRDQSGLVLPSTWRCTDAGNSGKTVTVLVTQTEPTMSVNWIAASTPVTITGRGVIRCA